MVTIERVMSYLVLYWFSIVTTISNQSATICHQTAISISGVETWIVDAQ